MTNGEKILILIVLLIFACFGAFFGIKKVKSSINENNLKKPETNSYDVFEKYEQDEGNNIENKISNEIEEKKENLTENIIEKENTQENNEIQEKQIIGREEQENENKEDSTKKASKNFTEEDAINAVKKEWGEDDSVYYTVANKDDENYYISVNDSSSTSVVAWYMVNIKTGKVSEN